MLELHTRARKTQQQWRPMLTVDECAGGAPPAGADGGCAPAGHAVGHTTVGKRLGRCSLASGLGALGGSVASDYGRCAGEGGSTPIRHREMRAVVDRVLVPTWIARAMVNRSAGLLRCTDGVDGRPIEMDQCELVRRLVCQLCPQCALTTLRLFLNLWTTSHWLRDATRDPCIFGCGRA